MTIVKESGAYLVKLAWQKQVSRDEVDLELEVWGRFGPQPYGLVGVSIGRAQESEVCFAASFESGKGVWNDSIRGAAGVDSLHTGLAEPFLSSFVEGLLFGVSLYFAGNYRVVITRGAYDEVGSSKVFFNALGEVIARIGSLVDSNADLSHVENSLLPFRAYLDAASRRLMDG